MDEPEAAPAAGLVQRTGCYGRFLSLFVGGGRQSKAKARSPSERPSRRLSVLKIRSRRIIGHSKT